MLSLANYDWVERQKYLVEFCIEARCWDGVDHEAFVGWLNNFPDNEGEYYALRLLHRFIYYSETDTIQLCRHGLFNLLLGQEVLAEQKRSGFSKPQDELLQQLDQGLRDSRIVPLLDQDKPFESGNLVTRWLVQRLSIPGGLIVNPVEMVEEIEGGCNRIVIVDDCVGSGDQIVNFWNEPIKGYPFSPNELAQNRPQVKFDYLTLVAVRSGLQQASKETPGLRITACETLGDEHRVFGPNSQFFHSQDEQDNAEQYLQSLLPQRGIRIRGHDGLDYAIAFNHNIPDWTLPLFHKKRPNWRPLMLRKDSDD
ncbi:hypothetical protein ACFLXE_00265 [Chloroflexota bacterium]